MLPSYFTCVIWRIPKWNVGWMGIDFILWERSKTKEHLERIKGFDVISTLISCFDNYNSYVCLLCKERFVNVWLYSMHPPGVLYWKQTGLDQTCTWSYPGAYHPFTGSTQGANSHSQSHCNQTQGQTVCQPITSIHSLIRVWISGT